jgi:hypothetical protein
VRIINESRLVPLTSRVGTEVVGRVRVRGVEALSGQGGFHTEHHQPEAILVRGASGEREIPLEETRAISPGAFIVAPAIALILMRLMRMRLIRRKGQR